MLVKDSVFRCPSARFRPTSNLHQLRIWSPKFNNMQELWARKRQDVPPEAAIFKAAQAIGCQSLSYMCYLLSIFLSGKISVFRNGLCSVRIIAAC